MSDHREKKHALDGKMIILYGAGKVGERTAGRLLAGGLRPECFCDADPSKRGAVVKGLPVKGIDDVKAQYKDGAYAIYISMHPVRIAGVREKLISEAGFPPGCFCGDGDFEALGASPSVDPPRAEARRFLEEAEKRFLSLDDAREADLRREMARYFAVKKAGGEEYVRTELGRIDFDDHLHDRQRTFRNTAIPWLASHRALGGARMLEIGCGTGSATVALCEQGAMVTGIDIDGPSLDAARKRSEIYGVSPDLRHVNATDIDGGMFPGGFDFVILAASLEHMTHRERLAVVRAAFDLTRDDGFVVVWDTPNRLWAQDLHTAWSPFFHWLPDELAIAYACFTPRQIFNGLFENGDDSDNALTLARWGRGVSYHEFEVALGSDMLRHAQGMQDFLGWDRHEFTRALRAFAPAGVADAFFWPELAFSLPKNSTLRGTL